MDSLITELSTYIAENWKSTLTILLGGIVSLVTGTWFVARHWYTREIRHQAVAAKSAKELHIQELAFADRQLSERTSYASGIVALMEQRLKAAEEEPLRLKKKIELDQEKIRQLENENEQLLLEGKKQGASNDLSFWTQKFAVRYSIKEVGSIAKFNSKIDPDNRHLAFINSSVKSYEKSSDSESPESLKAFNSIIIYFLKVQSQQLYRKDEELNICRGNFDDVSTNYLKTIVNIVRPLTDSDGADYSEVDIEKLRERLKEIQNRKSSDECPFKDLEDLD